jgi:hypothetical protein
MKYMQDAQHLMEMCLRHPELQSYHSVSPFKDSLIHRDGRNVMRLLQYVTDRSDNVKTLNQAATIFIENMLRVKKLSNQYRNPAYLLRLSYSLKLENLDVDQHLTRFIDSLPTGFKESAFAHYSLYRKTAQSQAEHLQERIKSLEEELMKARLAAPIPNTQTDNNKIHTREVTQVTPAKPALLASPPSKQPRPDTAPKPTEEDLVPPTTDKGTIIEQNLKSLKEQINMILPSPDDTFPSTVQPAISLLQQTSIAQRAATAHIIAHEAHEDSKDSHFVFLERVNKYKKEPSSFRFKFEEAKQYLKEKQTALFKVNALSSITGEIASVSTNLEAPVYDRYLEARRQYMTRPEDKNLEGGSTIQWFRRLLDPFALCFFCHHHASPRNFLTTQSLQDGDRLLHEDMSSLGAKCPSCPRPKKTKQQPKTNGTTSTPPKRKASMLAEKPPPFKTKKIADSQTQPTTNEPK